MLRITPLTAILALCALETLQAQKVSESTSVHLRNDCRLAVQILTKGEPHPHRDWALETIGSCNESGPPVLAGLWDQAPSDTTVLNRLYWSSRNLQDQRLLDGLIAVASDRARSTALRFGALRVLATYVDPHLDPGWKQLEPPEPAGPFLGIGSVFDAAVYEGTVPFAEDTKERILDFLRGLAEDDSDPGVRYAAQKLHHRLTAR